MHATWSQFFKFAGGGAVGTVLHYLTLVALVETAEWPIVAGTAIGFVVGAVTNYLISRNFIFRTERSHATALPRFLVVASIGAALNTSMVVALNDVGLHYLFAQILSTCVVLLFNFAVNKLWTFS